MKTIVQNRSISLRFLPIRAVQTVEACPGKAFIYRIPHIRQDCKHAEKGLELVDLEFVKEGVNWYLRVYIDKDSGVNIDDCEAVSRALEVKLDEKDPIEQAYILEVSSPGIDRPLKKDADFVKYQGEIIDVKLYKAQDGSKQYQGRLLGLENGVLSIEEENGNVVKFEQKDIASVRLAVIF